jgi:hypothetical protein
MMRVLTAETGKRGPNTQGSQPCEDRGRDWSDACISPETPGASRNQKRQKDSPPEAMEGVWP